MATQFRRNNLGLFCYSPEAGEVVRVLMGKYRGDGKADYDLALSGFSVEPWRSDRVGRGSCQITPCLSMLLLVQPSILREILSDEEALDRGMTARLLAFVVETEPQEDDGIDRQIDPNAEAGWDRLIRSILNRRLEPNREPHKVQASPEAREVLRAFHNESVKLRRGKYRHDEAELGRWRELAMRLALGQCIADNLNNALLTGEQASSAVEIMRWCARSMLAITTAARIDQQRGRVTALQQILGDKGGKVTLNLLKKHHGFAQEEVEALADAFPELVALDTVEPGESGGRPSRILRLASLGR